MGEVEEIRRALRELADPKRAKILQGFFKTGPGEYGEGDRFLGLTVPQLRALSKRFHQADFSTLPSLISSPDHEERLLGLLLLIERYRRGAPLEKAAAFGLYLASFPFVNNWDLVDLSAPDLVGAHGVDRSQLLVWAASPHLWTRRIAIVSTWASIRKGRFGDTLAVAARLLGDPHDLIHKASGWMLREVGKRDRAALEGFLKQHHARMPRTMLRYAIERFPEARRQAWLRGRPPI